MKTLILKTPGAVADASTFKNYYAANFKYEANLAGINPSFLPAFLASVPANVGDTVINIEGATIYKLNNAGAVIATPYENSVTFPASAAAQNISVVFNPRRVTGYIKVTNASKSMQDYTLPTGINDAVYQTVDLDELSTVKFVRLADALPGPPGPVGLPGYLKRYVLTGDINSISRFQNAALISIQINPNLKDELYQRIWNEKLIRPLGVELITTIITASIDLSIFHLNTSINQMVISGNPNITLFGSVNA